MIYGPFYGRISIILSLSLGQQHAIIFSILMIKKSMSHRPFRDLWVGETQEVYVIESHL